MKTNPTESAPQIGWDNIRELLHGYLRFILFGIALIIVNIWCGYKYQYQEQITSKLLKSLQALHTRNLFLSAERINRERLEHIEEQVSKLQLPLVRSTEPPFLVVDTLRPKTND